MFNSKLAVEIIRQAKCFHVCACVKKLYDSISAFSSSDYSKVFTFAIVYMSKYGSIFQILNLVKNKLPLKIYTWFNCNFYRYFDLKKTHYDYIY